MKLEEILALAAGLCPRVSARRRPDRDNSPVRTTRPGRDNSLVRTTRPDRDNSLVRTTRPAGSLDTDARFR